MYTINIELGKDGNGAAVMNKEIVFIGRMDFSISDQDLFVHHTEIIEEEEGKGLAQQLLAAVATYAREHGLKVIPLCSYVLGQFTAHKAAYSDIWKIN